MGRIVHLSIRENATCQIQKLDVFIEPEGLTSFSLFDTKKMEEIIEVGYTSAKQIELEKLLA